MEVVLWLGMCWLSGSDFLGWKKKISCWISADYCGVKSVSCRCWMKRTINCSRISEESCCTPNWSNLKIDLIHWKKNLHSTIEEQFIIDRDRDRVSWGGWICLPMPFSIILEELPIFIHPGQQTRKNRIQASCRAIDFIQRWCETHLSLMNCDPVG